MTLLSGQTIEQLAPLEESRRAADLGKRAETTPATAPLPVDGPEVAAARHKALVRFFVEEVRNKGNLDVLPDLVVSELLDGFQLQARALREAFGKYRVEVQSLTAEGNTVVLRAMQHGVHQGTYLGVPPTGRHVTWGVVRFFELTDGRISSTWVLADELALLKQFGVVP